MFQHKTKHVRGWLIHFLDLELAFCFLQYQLVDFDTELVVYSCSCRRLLLFFFF